MKACPRTRPCTAIFNCTIRMSYWVQLPDTIEAENSVHALDPKASVRRQTDAFLMYGNMRLDSEAHKALGPTMTSPVDKVAKAATPQIHPYRALVFSGAEVGVRRSIHGDGNKPAVGHPGDGGRDDLAGKPQRARIRTHLSLGIWIRQPSTRNRSLDNVKRSSRPLALKRG